jgi:V/A-type H+/Na+-transporting ATPase subunit D
MTQRLNIAPTKSAWLDLRRQIHFLEQGHDLLERKRELLRQLVFSRLAEYRRLHNEVRVALEQGYHWLALSQMRMGSEMLRQAAVGLKPALQVKILPRSDIGVEYPAVTAESHPLQPVGLMWTDPSFDETRARLVKVAVLLARLGEAETVLWRFLEEWRRTQKRVNALKYNVLPRYRETFRYIESELEEDERNMLFQIRALRKTSENEANEENLFLPKS